MSDTYLTRKTLLKRLKSMGDEMAWEEFVLYYKGFIYSIIFKMRINSTDCDDIVQDVLLRIWKSLDQFNHNQRQGHFRSWVHAITKNSVLTYIDKSKRIDNKIEMVKADKGDGYDEPAIDRIINEEWERHISGLAFESVREKVSAAAMEAFLAGLRNEPAEQTASELNISEELVYTYRSRVKMKVVAEIRNLREMLE